MPQKNHYTSSSDPSQHPSYSGTDRGSDDWSNDWSDDSSDDSSDTESSADGHDHERTARDEICNLHDDWSSANSDDHERTALDEICNLLEQVIKAWKRVSLIILSNLLFNTLLICITHSPIAPLVFAGILLGFYTLITYMLTKRCNLAFFLTFSKYLSEAIPFILPPLILSIPMISTPLVNMSSLYAWAFIGISALICYSYKKFNTPKQASVDGDTSGQASIDGDTSGNELFWHPDSFQSDCASLTRSSSLSDSNSSFVSTQSTEGHPEPDADHSRIHLI